VRSLQVEFEAPARLDDLLDCRLELTRLGRASFELAQELWRGEQCLLRAGVRIACLHASSFRPRALPPRLAAAIEAPLPNRAPPLGDAPR
jgi:acyl-CoA thioester hydrolase